MALNILDNEMELLDDLKRGNERAFRKIYFHYYDFLLSYAYKLSQEEHEAQDIVQDIFLNIWNKREQLTIETSLLQYLHQSVRFGFLKNERKKGVDSVYKQSLRQFVLNYVPSGDEYLFEKELMARLEKIAENLPGKEGRVFMLFHFEQYSREEIAEILGISHKTVNNLMAKAVTDIKIKAGLSVFISFMLSFRN